MWMLNKHMKNFSTSLAITEMQIKFMIQIGKNDILDFLYIKKYLFPKNDNRVRLDSVWSYVYYGVISPQSSSRSSYLLLTDPSCPLYLLT